jgi:hypothetical protein
LPPRPSMLDPVREQLLAWLGAEPDLSAVAALQRLLARHPEGFRPEHLRTVQRFLRSSRAVMARDVLLGEPGTARGGGRADRRTRDTPGLGSIST